MEDVDAIATFIARDSSQYAAAVVRRILSATRQLSDFPHSGRVVPELDDDSVRELLIYSYRLIYEIGRDIITVAAVVHSKQSFAGGVGRLRNRMA